MHDDDVRTLTFRARLFAAPPIAGSFISSPSGKSACRIERVITVRTAGDPGRDRFRLMCSPALLLAELPAGAAVAPWPTEPRSPPRSARKPAARPPSADPAPLELAGARHDRLQFKVPVFLGMMTQAIRNDRRNAVTASLARAAAVGRDIGKTGERDRGPGLRLHAVVGPKSELLREADVEMVDGPDPADPNVTLRRARRVDPLAVLRSFGTIEERHLNAAEQLRASLENLSPSTASAAMFKVSAPLFRSMGEKQLAAAEAVRTALAAIAKPCQAVVIWTCTGGTLSQLAKFAQCRQTTLAARLRVGLDQLADHLFGVGGSFVG